MNTSSRCQTAKAIHSGFKVKLGQGAFGRINSLTWGNGLNLNRHFDQDGRLS